MPSPRPNMSEDAARALADDLRREGVGSVRFDSGYRALYATDAANWRHVPIGVVVPKSIDEIVTTFDVCRKHDAPIVMRGGGTALAGQTCNTAVVIDTSKHLNRVVSLDPEARRARVESGCYLDTLRDAARKYDLTFGPNPATHNHCTFGGMIGNNSCGVESVRSGRTSDNIASMDVLTYDGLRMTVGPTSEDELEAIIREGGRRGEIYGRLKSLRDRHGNLIRARFPKIPRRVSGYNLDELLPENGFHVARALVGSEGTLVTVLEAEVQLIDQPTNRVLAIVGFTDIFAAADHIPQLRATYPTALEGMDDILVGYARQKQLHVDKLQDLPDGAGWLLIEYGGDTREEAEERAQVAVEALRRSPDFVDAHVRLDPGRQDDIWQVRESGLGATAFVPGMPDTWPGWEDSAVAPERLGDYLRDLRRLMDRFGYRNVSFYGHFGDGLVHCRVPFDLASAEGVAKYRRFLHAAAELVHSYDGTLSGEHGDGQARSELLPRMYGPEMMDVFREFKAIWDPDNRMNPGRIVEPYRPDEDLRLGPDYDPPELDTVFAYPKDGGQFHRAALRCVGVGKCRRDGGGVMCPSYMATKEEMHSTRGRARLLFEMVNGPKKGGPVEDMWRSDAVREALDLCLACKGCKSDCPVNVDMATYKSEFYHHYYKGRVRPPSAYSMGLIWWWSRIGGSMPGVANFVLGNPYFSTIVKRLGGIAPERSFPRYARQTYRKWHRQRGPRHGGRSPVILWPDTFNNYFHPETAIAATEVLEDAGFDVILPRDPLCCQRPLMAWGMMDLARRELGRVLDTLSAEIDAGIPVVGIEPACVAVFRDELPNLFPNDPRAKKLCEQTFLLSEFLAKKTDYRPPRLDRKAKVHVHCNHHAVLDVAAERQMMDAMGLDYELLDSGCCGMAGSFGFEHDHYEVSIKCAQRVLYPAVRSADSDTLILTNGFSCREQIRQGVGTEALTLPDVLKMALDQRKTQGERR